MGIASATIDAARPRSRDVHLLQWGDAAQLFLPDGSKLFDIDEALAEALTRALESGDGEIAVEKLLAELEIVPVPDRCSGVPEDRRVRALSLAVAQSCNLGCSYCYAQGGAFGSA